MYRFNCFRSWQLQKLLLIVGALANNGENTWEAAAEACSPHALAKLGTFLRQFTMLCGRSQPISCLLGCVCGHMGVGVSGLAEKLENFLFVVATSALVNTWLGSMCVLVAGWWMNVGDLRDSGW